jgi:hypothetical protein
MHIVWIIKFENKLITSPTSPFLPCTVLYSARPLLLPLEKVAALVVEVVFGPSTEPEPEPVGPVEAHSGEWGRRDDDVECRGVDGRQIAEVAEAAEAAEEAQDDQLDEVAEGFGIGETVAMGDLEHTFHGARFYDGDDFMNPDEGTRWLLVDVEVTNTGDESEAMSSLIMWDVVDADNRTRDLTITGDEQGSLDGELGAGRSMRGEIAYTVTDDQSEWELIFAPHVFGFGQAIYEFSVEDVQ